MSVFDTAFGKKKKRVEPQLGSDHNDDTSAEGSTASQSQSQSQLPKFLRPSTREIDEYIEDLKTQALENPPTDYAPLDHPARMEAVGRITANALREAVDATCKEHLRATDELLNITLAIQSDAQQFVRDLYSLGEAHANQIEAHTSKLQGFLEAMQRERERFFPTSTSSPNPLTAADNPTGHGRVPEGEGYLRADGVSVGVSEENTNKLEGAEVALTRIG